jgi:outer membrane protein OmpA-like peptidoglycan-associated protein
VSAGSILRRVVFLPSITQRVEGSLVAEFATRPVVGAAGGTSDRLLLGACLIALGLLGWLCVFFHAPALASARHPAPGPLVALPPSPLPPVAAQPQPVSPPPPSPAPLRIQAELDRLLANGRIDFKPGSDLLEADSTPLLDAVAQLLASEPELKVEVEGHTDSHGDPASNRRLSQRRAQAVQTYLASKGIDAKRIHTVGSGSTRPLVRAQTPEAYEMNRRIEFHVLAPGSR